MADFKGKRALVVDDEKDNIDFLSQILEDQGFDTSSARNGIEAMQRVKERKPDIIFLDLMMPGQSGIAFFHDLKKQRDYQSIPVIIVSGASKTTGVDMKSFIFDKAKAALKKKVTGIDAKPDAYIEKPVDPAVLVATVEKVLA
ncbi:MAG: response regulator [Elusimicrobia bacterium]|nr:response regulator [Elusimicrobiota bacterium]